ncbi:hypothetical protein SAMN05421666_3131 [Roseovarius nanhaiticus]|uniref:Uncharacterized protein n=1 Tax=Roseovarius nanhaiticus TaxID=573024 RepID=A0A1N7HIQ8_9RHOB|nr:DUF6477 family protein [Roseovarius nanhaiticus]SEK92476.1 hypothetical protein SAMN05216208_2185 [Roseovarius nanhaiticus]SIS24611.1 hypothetical protein SAMN05421666_3131 [Roseovarius nanhaiticus]
MHDILKALDTLRRPRLLIRAARIGAAEYRREAHLRRHFGYGTLPRSAAALARLVEMEEALNDQRKTGTNGFSGGYSATRHVEILIAMMGEARILRSTRAA